MNTLLVKLSLGISLIINIYTIRVGQKLRVTRMIKNRDINNLQPNT